MCEKSTDTCRELHLSIVNWCDECILDWMDEQIQIEQQDEDYQW